MSKKPSILISAAGTGGHLFPAQHVARELQKEHTLLFVGKGLSKNPYFARDQFAYQEIAAATFSLRNPLQLIKALFPILKGTYQGVRLIQKKRPQVIIAFGSFYTLPLLLAAILKRVPFVLHEQNVLPGRVNRLFSAFAHCTAITFDESQEQLKGVCQRVQFPKNEWLEESKDCNYFGLQPGTPILLVFGGSQGAAFINELVKEACTILEGDFQIIHLVGKEADLEEWRRFYEREKIPACIKPFEHQMHRALAVADLAICRAGAATICELIEFELPAILIPFAQAMENHQQKNADFFVERVGGGYSISEGEANGALLAARMQENFLEKKRAIAQYKSKERSISFSSMIKKMVKK